MNKTTLKAVAFSAAVSLVVTWAANNVSLVKDLTNKKFF